MTDLYPFLILGIGIAIVVGGIVVIRLNAFLALIAAAMVVSLLSPGAWSEKISRVSGSFGSTAAGIGIVIALAAIIGKAMTESGAADRIVQSFLSWLGEKRAPTVLMSSGFVLAIPVFFDTVFYLLVPLARSMFRRTGKQYLRYLLAIACSAAAHALVPPTPGPLLVADALNVDLGMMILIGCMVGFPAAMAGLAFAAWADRRAPDMKPPEEELTAQEVAELDEPRQLPGLGLALAPIVSPVILITLNSFFATMVWSEQFAKVPELFKFIGDPNFALLISAAIALTTMWIYRRPSKTAFASSIESALMSGGVIVLITCAGGAFGGALKGTGIATAIENTFGDSAVAGLGLLFLSFFVAALIKFAQGSSTAAMIVTSGMIAAMIGIGDSSTELNIGFHPVYLATAIGGGSLVGSWMNDSGFWIFSKMGGLTEIETLKTWTPCLAILGIVAFIMTLILAIVMPMTG